MKKFNLLLMSGFGTDDEKQAQLNRYLMSIHGMINMHRRNVQIFGEEHELEISFANFGTNYLPPDTDLIVCLSSKLEASEVAGSKMQQQQFNQFYSQIVGQYEASDLQRDHKMIEAIENKYKKPVALFICQIGNQNSLIATDHSSLSEFVFSTIYGVRDTGDMHFGSVIEVLFSDSRLLNQLQSKRGSEETSHAESASVAASPQDNGWVIATDDPSIKQWEIAVVSPEVNRGIGGEEVPDISSVTVATRIGQAVRGPFGQDGAVRIAIGYSVEETAIPRSVKVILFCTASAYDEADVIEKITQLGRSSRKPIVWLECNQAVEQFGIGLLSSIEALPNVPRFSLHLPLSTDINAIESIAAMRCIFSNPGVRLLLNESRSLKSRGSAAAQRLSNLVRPSATADEGGLAAAAAQVQAEEAAQETRSRSSTTEAQAGDLPAELMKELGEALKPLADDGQDYIAIGAERLHSTESMMMFTLGSQSQIVASLYAQVMTKWDFGQGLKDMMYASVDSVSDVIAYSDVNPNVQVLVLICHDVADERLSQEQAKLLSDHNIPAAFVQFEKTESSWGFEILSVDQPRFQFTMGEYQPSLSRQEALKHDYVLEVTGAFHGIFSHQALLEQIGRQPEPEVIKEAPVVTRGRRGSAPAVMGKNDQVQSFDKIGRARGKSIVTMIGSLGWLGRNQNGSNSNNDTGADAKPSSGL